MSNDASIRVVLYAGQAFMVPLETDEAAIRQSLTASFPDVATATVRETTYEQDGATYPAIEFVKQAGRKGSDDLPALLRRIPHAHYDGGKTPIGAGLNQLLAGTLTIDAILEHLDELDTALIHALQHDRTTDPLQRTARSPLLTALAAIPAQTLHLQADQRWW